MLERNVLLLVFNIYQYGVSLVECPAAAILSTHAHRRTRLHQTSESQRFRHSVVNSPLALSHFSPLLEQFFDFGMDVKIRRIAAQAPPNFTQLFQRQSSGYAVFLFVTPTDIVIPISRQVTHQRLLLNGLSGFLSFFQFRANGLNAGFGVGSPGALCIDLPQRRMVFDGLVQKRLGDGWVVHFTVAVTAIAD